MPCQRWQQEWILACDMLSWCNSFQLAMVGSGAVVAIAIDGRIILSARLQQFSDRTITLL
jgi:hypothetical protein